MWLATRYGFFSLSDPGDGTIVVRSHLRRDLENLMAETVSGEIRNVAKTTDLPWEMSIDRDGFLRIFDSLLRESDSGDLATTIGETPGQESKAPAYRTLQVGLLKLRMAEWETAAVDDCDRKAWEEIIREEIKSIAKQSCLVGMDDHEWDVSHISWTGEEWSGFRPLPGHCYVEAFEHANPPHDFIYVVSILNGEAEFAASYEGDMDSFDLTIWRQDAEALDLPDSVPRP